ncbi:MAG: glycosyltransferase family 4 protein [candidate division Zixibacteria bacterium]
MNETLLKVLLLADSRSFHTQRYAEQLRSLGCTVLLASMEQSESGECLLKKRGPVKSLHYALARSEIYDLAKQFKPDVINPHFASGYGFMSAFASLQKLAPVVLNLWGSDILLVPSKSMLHRQKTIFALRKADLVIGDSEFLLSKARELYPFAKSKVIVWGIEREYLKLHRTDYSPNKPLRIIVPRPHESVYDNLFILSSLTDLINSGKILITFPQAGSQFEFFQGRARELTGDKVKFYAPLPRDRFIPFMAEHDLYLSASRSDSSPASLIEAMGLGLIPVAANIEGVREWLSDDSGFRYEPENETALADLVTKLAGSSDTNERMRQANFKRVKNTAIFEENVAEMIELMTRLVRER